MQFTPQQLAGAAKYSHKCRIGNWNEDLELEETQLKDYFLKKQRGQLLVDKAIKRNELTLQPVPHSYHEDGNIRFGDSILLQCNSTGGFLANNLWDPLGYEKEAYSVTTCSTSDAVARNTWVISRPKGEGKSQDDILRYGQNFMLACNPSLRVDENSGTVQSPYFLQSEIVTHSRSAKLSNYQVVCLTGGRPVYAMQWQIKRPATRRYVPDGDPVPSGAEILIVHAPTNQALYCDPRFSLLNDYGTEHEVSGHTHQSVKKTHNLVSEWSGTTTGDVPSRSEESTNRWRLLLSTNPATAVDERGLTDMTPELLLAKVKAILNTKGNYGFRGLAKVFKLMDQVGDGKLDREDFRFGLLDYGVQLTDTEFEMLLSVFDANGDGYIGLTEFMRAVRDPMNERRAALVQRAYAVLDTNGDGQVTLSDVAAVYNASAHPDVIEGRSSEAEILQQFMTQWDTQQRDGIVSAEEFTTYYGDISAAVPSDDYFEQMICTAWGLSQGK